MGVVTGWSLLHVDHKAAGMQPCWACIIACTGVYQSIGGCTLSSHLPFVLESEDV